MTAEEAVQAYITNYRQRAQREMAFYKRQPDLESVIRVAALCRTESGGKHDHQRRLPPTVLASAEQRLQALAPTLNGAADFATLHDVIEDEFSSTRGIGELYVYDVAHRIGAFLGLEPALVYLHAGTRKGVASFGKGWGKTVRPDSLPPAFARLTPAEIEDCLCLFASELQGAPLSRTKRPAMPGGCMRDPGVGCGRNRPTGTSQANRQPA